MKNILKTFGLIAFSVMLLASCDWGEIYNPNVPSVFDDKDAFVAFDKTSYSYNEDYEGIISIPVTLGSVAGLEESVPFKVISPEEKGAVDGINFEMISSSGVVSFSRFHRTDYIKLKVMPDGKYTGDLKLQIALVATESINLGESSVCTITISDIDHPLNSILGTYTASSSTGADYFGRPQTPWTLTLIKDAEDETKVWFDDIFGVPGWAGDDMLYYGIVTMDGTTPVSVSVPLGQEAEYKYSGTMPVLLLGFDGAAGYDSGAIEMTFIYGADGKITLDFGSEFGVWIYIDPAGNLIIWDPGTVSAVKD